MIRLGAGCKVNLGLRIIRRRDDGYHELDSLFWPLFAPRDELHIQYKPGNDIIVRSNNPAIDPACNTLTKAHNAFATLAGKAPGIEVQLCKRIPSGAGLGGGSSDAAALLLWLNSQAERPISSSALAHAALAVGADVPFFLAGQPSRVRGIGEIVEPVKIHIPSCFIVLVCPDIHVSTAKTFALFDKEHGKSASHINDERQNSLTKHACTVNGILRLEAVHLDLHNDLESIVFYSHPQLAVIKAELNRLGAFASAMTGSGSSVFGLFASQATAQAVAARLRGQYPRVYCQTLETAGM